MKIKHKEMQEREVTDKVICDLCGVEIKDSDYDINSVTIEHKKGWSVPEGGSVEEISPDICPGCWCNTILPFLREKGLKTEYQLINF